MRIQDVKNRPRHLAVFWPVAKKMTNCVKTTRLCAEASPLGMTRPKLPYQPVSIHGSHSTHNRGWGINGRPAQWIRFFGNVSHVAYPFRRGILSETCNC